MRAIIVSILFFAVLPAANAGDEPIFDLQPIVNEVSLYQNSSDGGDNLGQTLQIVSINTITLWTTFNLEFTADFNRELTEGTTRDYYLEVGLVKPVWRRLSANYQRVHGTFVDEPVNQFGIRWSF